MPHYIGTIVEESLDDNRILNNLNIVGVEISEEADVTQRWHLYRVTISKQQIKHLATSIKNGWYAHFWKDNEMIIVFKGKTFTLSITDKKTWKQAIDYGLSVGIPKKQLDFKIE